MLAFGVPAGLGYLLRGLGVESFTSHGLQSNAHWGVVRAHRALTGGSDIIQNHEGKGGRLQGLQPAQGAICKRHALLSLRIPLCRSGGRAWPILNTCFRVSQPMGLRSAQPARGAGLSVGQMERRVKVLGVVLRAP